jgi:hypothetical protein
VLAGAHDRLHDGAVEDHDQLVGQELGIRGAAALGLAGEKVAQPQLVVARHPPGEVAGDRIWALTRFEKGLLSGFGLPRSLPAVPVPR